MAKTLVGNNFYGSVPEEIMKEFNARIQGTYWRAALDQSNGILKKKKNWFVSPTKSSFLPYLNLKKDDIALDIGAGGGVISEALSKKGSIIEYNRDRHPF